jgi:hypothetical protein
MRALGVFQVRGKLPENQEAEGQHEVQICRSVLAIPFHVGYVFLVIDPILRAKMESGETWDDPSEGLLFMLLCDIEGEEETFVIVERLSDRSGQTYAQVIRNDDGGWMIERRDGGPDHHYRAVFSDLHTVHAVLTAWAFELPSFPGPNAWETMTF